MAKVAFLGLGVMGFPMAGHLKKKGGHEVTVYNRNAAKAEYLSTLPKDRWKRLAYRLHPKRVAQYWFSREGGIMSAVCTLRYADGRAPARHEQP